MTSYREHNLNESCVADNQRHGRLPTTSPAKNKGKEAIVVWTRLHTPRSISKELLQGIVEGRRTRGRLIDSTHNRTQWRRVVAKDSVCALQRLSRLSQGTDNADDDDDDDDTDLSCQAKYNSHYPFKHSCYCALTKQL